jgi:glutamate 5-kinase
MFEGSKTIVIKIGSSLLMNECGELNKAWVSSLAEDINYLNSLGARVVLVSSGAVSLGRKLINNKRVKLKIEEKQAAAAIGQPMLINEYSKVFAQYNTNCAQVLITIPDAQNRRRYLNTQNTLETLLDNNILPIVNENDTIATDELRFGDNDRLSALVAQMIMSDHLIILSDVDGLYTDDPNKNPDAEHLAVVEEIDDRVLSIAKGTGSKTGTGGMITKVRAAEIAAVSGCKTIISLGKILNPVRAIMNGARNTLFDSSETPLSARKKWIHTTLKSRGKIIIDAGAVKALKSGNSLLPIGITSIKNRFSRGDIVQICGHDEIPIAKGITAYGSSDLRKIIGKHTDDISKILGYTGREAVIHLDDMVLL